MSAGVATKLQSPWRQWLVSDSPHSATQAKMGRIYRGWCSFRRSATAVFGFTVIAGLVLMAVLAPWLAPGSPTEVMLDQRLLPPGGAHWFGTDELGRDIYTRIVHGSRITLYTVSLVAAIVAPIGLLVGTTAGYFGGWLDRVLMRLTDIFLSFPRLVLALAFVASVGPGIGNAVIAIAITSWPAIARLARAETLTIRKSEYILAARQQGASAARILWRYVTPMCISSVIIRVTLDMAHVILVAAGLGFLGLGAQPPSPEWGAMLSTGREYVFDYWWIATFPGLAILVVSLGFNLVGDGLRDVLDPRHAG
ncbi:ABC transporter permease [Mesorhizobium sp. B2-6-5]|uniref:ABC transporter permease n=1 Tax=Mesorhizobium sp. B2-6-5 TaxID=2589912 RepID=UPI0011263235|nr:ABC transporter permease [Mesorhizobium sp. B2-6-5]TPJ38560.1 ABC transporter permease [Mesorhizobium sp. B2-6-5]